MRISRSLSSKLLLDFCAVLILAPFGEAQITTVTNSTSTPIPGAGHDYIHLLSEIVDPANGSLSLRISTPTPPGRHLALPFFFAYDSNGVHVVFYPGSNYNFFWKSNTAFLGQGGWEYSLPMMSSVGFQVPATPPHGGACNITTDYFFQDVFGGRHGLGLTTNSQPATYCSAYGGSILSGRVAAA
jgi:hypothetical protein